MIRYPSLKERAVIVTGGGRGLGRVMALALAGQGARLLLTGAGNREALERTADEARAAGAPDVRTLVADVGDKAACEAAAALAREAFGRIDGLVNNAGVGTTAVAPEPGKPYRFWEARPDGYESLLKTNALGPFLMARAVIGDMLGQGFGRLVNVSTSRVTMIKTPPYGATKAYLEAATVGWARDLDGTGVTANVLLPGGAADTDFIPGAAGTRADPNLKPGKGPLGLEGDTSGGLIPPEVMAAPICWLMADESADTNGRRIVGRDWDPDLPGAEAAARAMTEPYSPPSVM